MVGTLGMERGGLLGRVKACCSVNRASRGNLLPGRSPLVQVLQKQITKAISFCSEPGHQLTAVWITELLVAAVEPAASKVPW